MTWAEQIQEEMKQEARRYIAELKRRKHENWLKARQDKKNPCQVASS